MKRIFLVFILIILTTTKTLAYSDNISINGKKAASTTLSVNKFNLIDKEWSNEINILIKRNNLTIGHNFQKRNFTSLNSGFFGINSNEELAKKECAVSSFIKSLSDYAQKTHGRVSSSKDSIKAEAYGKFNNIKITSLSTSNKINYTSKSEVRIILNGKLCDYLEEDTKSYYRKNLKCDINYFFNEIIKLQEKKKLKYILYEKPKEYCNNSLFFLKLN